MSSIRRPSWSLERLYLSGDRNFVSASSHSSTETLARPARPGIVAYTLPCLSAIASMVIQTMRTWFASAQIVLSVIDEKSFVKLKFDITRMLSQ